MSELRLFRRLESLRPSELRALPSHDEVAEALPPPTRRAVQVSRDEFVPAPQTTVRLDLTGQGHAQDVTVTASATGLTTT
jgi:hypothetical protein